MANAPTGRTELTELVEAEAINRVILEYARDYTPSADYLYWKDLRMEATKVASFPRWVLDATEDIGETTALTTVALETTDVQVTAAEIGLYREITYQALEDTVIGQNLFEFLVMDAAELAGLSLEDDICALFPSLSNSVGTSAANLTIANMVEAMATIRSLKMRGQIVYILDDQQALDYQAAQAASTSTTINAMMVPAAEVNMTGYLGTFWGAPIWTSGLCDTANTGANVVGAAFIRGDTNPRAAAFGACLARDVTTKLDEDIQKRRFLFAMTARWGVAEINDDAGVKIVTDA